MADAEDDKDSKAKQIELNMKESEIVAEFCNLIEQSRQLFKSLRDLPQFGQKSWQTQFGKTFDIYTKLWKFQQENRTVLDKKYDLKRWQIGEIASKIGQLYYHYYLRTSQSNYLQEAFSFYTAIRSRAYYSNASKLDTSDLMVKKLRFYARFIVVTLLLNKMDFVKELIK
ncbi:SCAI isoform X1, partial [Paramuricea clavata]